MFGTYFKASLKALPVLLLFPIAVYVLYIITIDPNYVQMYTIAEGTFGELRLTWYANGPNFMLTSMIIAIITNLFFLMIIPSAIGGADPRSKKVEFYVGFFVNIFCTLLLPIIYFFVFGLDGATFGILIGLHTGSFLLPFILGARFVSPAYVRAFWFVS